MANRLLITKDYDRIIQAYDLNQIIEGNFNYVLEAEQVATSEIKSYIAKRYDTSTLFSNTSLFDINKQYNSDALVYVSAPYFVSGNTYLPTDRVVFSATNGIDYLYYCIASGSTGSTTYDTNFWSGGTLEDNTLFYVTPPAETYLIGGDYVVGSIVLYKNVLYTSLRVNNNRWLKEDWEREVNSETGSAVIPGFSNSWQDYWVINSATNPNPHITNYPYSVNGIYPDLDTTGTWTKGDNRNPIVVQYMMDIVLYHLHARINPRNVPELRLIRYDGNNPTQNGGAIAWLKKISAGQIQLDAQEIIPTQGQSIYWTSENKRKLNY